MIVCDRIVKSKAWFYTTDRMVPNSGACIMGICKQQIKSATGDMNMAGDNLTQQSVFRHLSFVRLC